MPRVSAPVYSLNGGEVGDEALSRLDLERLQFAGSLYSNMLPRVIGSMTIRPGLEHIADIDIGDVQLVEYSYSGGSSLVPILSDLEMRVVKDNAFISRVAVSTAITNGTFSSFTGWTDASSGGANASVSGGNLVLLGTSQDRAIARQTVTVSAGDQPKEHGIRLDVVRGPVNLRLGTTLGASDILNAIALDDGVHSIAFTPGVASVYLELSNENAREALVNSCTIEAAGVVVVPTPWTDVDLNDNRIRYRQHKDVLYTASSIYQQRMIQRRGDTSWGVQRYKVDDGPFVTSDGTVSLSPSDFVDDGNVTLTANRSFFDPGMIGRLFRIFQSGQTVDESFSTDPADGAFIRVAGVGSARRFSYEITGTWVGTVRLQVATDDGSGAPSSWTNQASFTSNTSDTYTDPDDNVVKFFRFAVETGGHTSGTIVTKLVYSGGSQSGIARMKGYVSPTVADIEIISRFYRLQASFEWDYSIWSDFDGWPAAVETFGGRVYWGLGDFIYGSVPDAYKSFDDEVEGDSAPISRSIGSNTDRGILWLLGLQRLLAGTDASEVSVKSSSFDEPLTASSWFPIESSTRGCFNIRAVKCDKDGIFVQSSGTAMFSLTTDQGTLDYGSIDLTAMHEMICDGSDVVDIAVQRRPDTVIWLILANGEARALTYEPADKVVAWSRVVTDGDFKRVIANRGAGQDNVYFAVVRDGTQRLERLANLEDCRGGALNCLADGFKRFTVSSPQTTFSVPHLNGLDVTVWVNGVAVHDQDNLYTVSGNQVVIPSVASGSVVIGLPYTGRWQSVKLAYGAAGGTALFHKKRVSQLGIYMTNTMLDGLRVGRSFTELRRLTTTKGDKPIQSGTLFPAFDADMMSISSDWDTDSRLCIEARAPYPFTAASLVMDVKTNG
ncbi:hypothetical protein SAMN02927900_01291 [Rhizobium mongolense subsp. loessense]|uniref:Uncharacterized protein n=1 Tax=Rhizobium mongolense subsp. loessense TaxID=158890 RepID=A0A1G4Q3G1_9HYPH|nr:hypothetical protein [Rhizobium mongolense]SCW39042.1 hypothetical protein SAMN02927900_01291 [Rhizobium mongolense subsp. loessense]